LNIPVHEREIIPLELLIDGLCTKILRFADQFVQGVYQSGILELNIARMGIVTKDDRILSANLFLDAHGRRFGIYLGTRAEGYTVGSNALLDYNIIKTLWEDGGKFYNHGGTGRGPGKEGLIYYKSGIGAVERSSWNMFSPVLQGGIKGKLIDIRKKMG
jgi:hypothetical protein